MANSNITKEAIRKAFFELLNEKPLSKITVKDISDRCGINRNTFYYHYPDTISLLEEMCALEFNKVAEKYTDISSIEDCIEAVMQYAKSNQRAVNHVFAAVDNSTYIASLWRVCEHIVRTYANNVFPDAPVSDEDRELLISYYKCSCFGLVVDWIMTGMKDEYIEKIRRICRLKMNSAEMIINNCLKLYQEDSDQDKA